MLIIRAYAEVLWVQRVEIALDEANLLARGGFLREDEGICPHAT